MARFHSLLKALTAIGFLCGSTSAIAQAEDDKPPLNTYMVSLEEASAPASGELQAKKNKALAQFIIRPELSVVLEGDIDSEIARRTAVKKKFPFIEGRQLFGWRDHPGLFCDLMRNRGLGSSAACLRDNDGDGKFDDAVRYDFNSASADMIFITDKGKVRGGHLKREQALTAPVPYSAITSGDFPTAKMNLLWESNQSKIAGSGQPVTIDITLTDGNNFTGTEVFAEYYARVRHSGTPVELEIYGTKIRIKNVDSEGSLSYEMTPIAKSAPVGFVFRGHIFRIVFY